MYVKSCLFSTAFISFSISSVFGPYCFFTVFHISFLSLISATALYFKCVILHLGKWKKYYKFALFSCESFKKIFFITTGQRSKPYACSTLKFKAHFYLTIYLQHKSSFYILVAMCEISVMLLWILHFLFIFALCLCALLLLSHLNEKRNNWLPF